MSGVEEKLHKEFMYGKVPSGLDGFYQGKLELVMPTNVIEYIGKIITSIYLPWKGKIFYEKTHSGDNILQNHLAFLQKFFPESVGKDTNGMLHAFAFRTAESKGLVDPINVLRLIYDLPENPLRLRKIVDELVEVETGNYLGKAHIVNRNAVETIAYFRLLKI